MTFLRSANHAPLLANSTESMRFTFIMTLSVLFIFTFLANFARKACFRSSMVEQEPFKLLVEGSSPSESIHVTTS